MTRGQTSLVQTFVLGLACALMAPTAHAHPERAERYALLAVEDHAVVLMVGYVPTWHDWLRFAPLGQPNGIIGAALRDVPVRINDIATPPTRISSKWVDQNGRPGVVVLAEWSTDHRAFTVSAGAVNGPLITWRAEAQCRAVSNSYIRHTTVTDMAPVLLTVSSWDDCPLLPR